MENIKSKFKHIPLLLSIVFFIFSCIVFFFLHKEINNKYKTSQETQIKWQQEEYKRNNLESLQSYLDDTQSERAVIESHFVYGSDVVPFLDMIENLAPKVGVEVEVLLVDISQDGASLTVDLSSQGSFEALYKFIMLLESSSYELEFIKMDLKKQDGGEDSLSEWQGYLKIKVLSFIP